MNKALVNIFGDFIVLHASNELLCVPAVVFLTFSSPLRSFYSGLLLTFFKQVH